MKLPTVIVCPGNGCTNIRQSNWYGHVFDQLQARQIPCICEDFPDPYDARRSIWIPHMRKLAKESDNVILVGHSSGAQAILRYTQEYPCRAAILVAATYSDLGDAHERASGYYPQGEDNPYEFERMRQNCPVWYQFHSDDDPFIPVHEAEQIRDRLDSKYSLLPGRSHFFRPFPELMDTLDELYTGFRNEVSNL